MKKLAYLLLLAALLPTGCVTAKHDVWENYDVRHPVPADAQVPDQYTHQYDAYQAARQPAIRVDNDSYYSLPYCAGFDSPACINSTKE